MRSNEKNSSEDNRPPKLGSRSYLRLTKLVLYLILFLTLGAITMLLALFVSNRNRKPEEINLNITVPTPVPTNPNKTLLQPVPSPPAPPKVFQPPGTGISNQRIPSTPPGNYNGMPIPSRTPRPSPVKTPTGIGP
jgi:hypothetical protein